MLSRRRFVVTAGFGLGVAASLCPNAYLSAASRQALAREQKQWLAAVLPPADSKFDPFAKMLVTTPGEEPGAAHRTRDSLVYAAALLDTGDASRIARAHEILRATLSLQDKEPTSVTYGSWQHYLEVPQNSPSTAMTIASCTIPLQGILIENAHQLDPQLVGQLREAVLHSARSLENLEFKPAMTLSVVMGLYVTRVAAQELKLRELRDLSRKRLRALYVHLRQQKSFPDYNSPTSTIAILRELSRFKLHVRDGRDRTLLTALLDMTWEHAATHFHAPTGQWAGPHSHSSATDLRQQPATLAFLQTACAGKTEFQLADPIPLDLDTYRLPLRCPRKWAKHFVKLNQPQEIIETFAPPDPTTPGSNNPVVGTTWLHPQLTLGSVNRGDLGQQRRPVLAYWGTLATPRFLRLRFLKNHQDFSSALVFTAQHRSSLLAAVAFATDRPASLNPGTIQAKDLRLRFEFGGDLGQFTVKTAGEDSPYLLLQDDKVRFILRPLQDGFGDTAFQWDKPDLKLAGHIDAVAYAGPQKTIQLDAFKRAFICFTLEEWPYQQKDPSPTEISLDQSNDRLQVQWKTLGKTLELELPTKPATYTALNDSVQARVMEG